MLSTVLAVAATFVTIARGWPQVSRIAVHKNTAGVSTATWTMMFLTNVVWAVLGVATGVLAIILANVLAAIAGFCVLRQIAKHSDFALRNPLMLTAAIGTAAALIAWSGVTILISVALSIIAACMTVPQLIKVFRTDPSGVSAVSWGMGVVSATTWSAYYVTIDRAILMLPNLVIAPCSLIVLIRVLWSRRSTPLSAGQPALLPE